MALYEYYTRAASTGDILNNVVNETKNDQNIIRN